jgi:O-antigen ligase
LFLLWSSFGLFHSVYVSNTINELSLLAGAWVLSLGAGALFLAHPEEKGVFARALVVLALAKAALALLIPEEGGKLFLDPGNAGSANLSFVTMFQVLALICGVSLSGRGWRAAWVALLASTLWLCVRWNSVSSLLGLAVGLPLSFAFRRGKRVFLGAALAAAAVLLAVVFSDSAPRWARYNPDDPARFERLAIWSDSLSLAKDHWVVGTGLGTFEQYYPRYKSLPKTRTANFAHNEWIQILCEGGVPAGILILLLLAGLWTRVRGREREAPEFAAGLVLIGLWAGLYFVFRSDSLLFCGAVLAGAFARPSEARVPPALQRFAIATAAVVAAAALSQGAAQLFEFAGGAAWRRKDPAAALALFRRAQSWNGREPRYLDEEVECLRALDRKAETLPPLERAVALKPRDVWLRRKLAVARLNLVGPASARDTYAPILDLDPNVEQFQREMSDLSAKAAAK